ncbi:MAG: sulfotransferase family 2 domain-containing protein [Litoreibacter sp.]
MAQEPTGTSLRARIKLAVMIISRGRNFIFVHIPKTGGTSLALALENRAMADDIMLGDTPKARNRRHRVKGVKTAGRLWKHSTLRDIEGLVSSEEIAKSFVFTIVRNPWDRLVSYYYWLREQHFEHPAVDAAKSLEFSMFLADADIARSVRQNPYGRYVVRGDGRERCDLFLRLEHMDEDLPKLEEALSIKLRPFPHENRSERPKYQDAYTRETRTLVAQMCATDIERFDYRF